MKLFIITFLTIFHLSYAPPVDKKKDLKSEEEAKIEEGLSQYMDYHRYLREVVGALESDPDFRQKLEKAEEADIRSGKIADQLEFVSHHVRTKLDEIKRAELERLKQLVEQRMQLEENTIPEDPVHHHLDQSKSTFEVEDLKKLIAKTTADLAEADKLRREEFKQYELQKEFEKQQKLNSSNGEEKEKLEKLYKEQEERHKKHEPLHEPGHKKQLEEVWEEQDHMQQEFDPKTFFMLHDLDSNGLWDETEVKALFIKELDKMYAAGAPEDDMRERIEEMERMRETVFQEMDANRDGFIEFREFLAQTKSNNFEQDHGWQGLDEQRPFSDEDLQRYIQMQQQMNQQHHPQQYMSHEQAYQAQQHHMNQPPPPPGYQHHPDPQYYPQQQLYQNQEQHKQVHPGPNLHYPPPEAYYNNGPAGANQGYQQQNAPNPNQQVHQQQVYQQPELHRPQVPQQNNQQYHQQPQVQNQPQHQQGGQQFQQQHQVGQQSQQQPQVVNHDQQPQVQNQQQGGQQPQVQNQPQQPQGGQQFQQQQPSQQPNAIPVQNLNTNEIHVGGQPQQQQQVLPPQGNVQSNQV